MSLNKKGIWIVTVAGLLLLGACIRGNQPVVTPTPTVVPTQSAEATETPVPEITASPIPESTVIPKVTPTVVPEPTVVPKVSPTPEPEISATPEPTEAPEPTETPVPEITVTTTPEPTVIPEVTPTEAPEPTPTEVPEPTKAPEISWTPDTELLINAGWQRTVDITENYDIVFPDCFDESKVERMEKELLISYSSTEKEGIKFYVYYTMEQTLEQALLQVTEAGGFMTENNRDEKQFSYRTDGAIIYRGTVLETSFSKVLLDSSFHEEEKITGTIHIVLEYPKEYCTEYETETYQYFLVPIL